MIDKLNESPFPSNVNTENVPHRVGKIAGAYSREVYFFLTFLLPRRNLPNCHWFYETPPKRISIRGLHIYNSR